MQIELNQNNDTLYISVELKRNLIEMSLLQWMVGSRYGFISENYQNIFGYQFFLIFKCVD